MTPETNKYIKETFWLSRFVVIELINEYLAGRSNLSPDRSPDNPKKIVDFELANGDVKCKLKL